MYRETNSGLGFEPSGDTQTDAILGAPHIEPWAIADDDGAAIGILARRLEDRRAGDRDQVITRFGEHSLARPAKTGGDCRGNHVERGRKRPRPRGRLIALRENEVAEFAADARGAVVLPRDLDRCGRVLGDA